tara:strand:- start:1805 stop:2662 length:858 start_codon:yes stop_codon:yes gene_type:complete
MKSKRDIEQEITDKIIAQLEEGVAPWRKSWASIDGGVCLRENGAPYRGWNQFILSMSGYSNPYWLTYNKATELGAQVRGGEKGTRITFWGKSKPKDPDADPFMFMKIYSVFNAEQIDGLPDRFFPVAVERTEVERDAAAENYIANIGADVRHGGGRAFYIPSEDRIQLPEVDDFDNYVSYAGTSIHEHAHWTGHESRLDRNIKNANGTKDYAREELVAECSAALVCGHLGLEVEPREDHASYLKSWLDVLKGDKTAIRKAFSQAQKVVDFLDAQQPAVEEEREAA